MRVKYVHDMTYRQFRTSFSREEDVPASGGKTQHGQRNENMARS